MYFAEIPPPFLGMEFGVVHFFHSFAKNTRNFPPSVDKKEKKKKNGEKIFAKQISDTNAFETFEHPKM